MTEVSTVVKKSTTVVTLTTVVKLTTVLTIPQKLETSKKLIEFIDTNIVLWGKELIQSNLFQTLICSTVTRGTIDSVKPWWVPKWT